MRIVTVAAILAIALVAYALQASGGLGWIGILLAVPIVVLVKRLPNPSGPDDASRRDRA